MADKRYQQQVTLLVTIAYDAGLALYLLPERWWT